MPLLEAALGGLTRYAVLHLVAATFVIYVAGIAVYRLLLSPIAGFPGPKLAALTQWYEFYYNVILPGQFFLHIETLHDKYGPIIRINPWELHIRDPEFYDTIYSATARRDKFPAHQWQQTPGSIVNTVHHDLHKRRRKALNPYFGKHQLQHFGTFIQSRADKICERLGDDFAGKGRILNWRDVWACYAGDNVMQYCFATNEDFLSLGDFRAPLIHALDEGLHIFPYLFYFPWLLPLMKMMPESLTRILSPDVIPAFQYEREVIAQILAIKNGKNQGHKDVSHLTVFKELLDSDLPPEEKSVDRLFQDGFTLVTAGMETTSYTLQIATCYILYHPSILRKLREELLLAIPNPANIPPLAGLEKLPYLTAVITEAIRLSYGNTFRLPRTFPDGPIQYGPYTIPSTTPVSMGHYSVSHNESLFPESHSFIPERWLDNPKAPPLNIMPPTINDHDSSSASLESQIATTNGGKPLSKYMVSFSKGSRQCIGMNLAYAELYIGLATVFRRVKMSLFETGPEAVDVKIDIFVPRPEKGSKGVRVIVESVD